MSTRMDRYYDVNTNKRSVKNKELYKTIYDGIEYSNIEGVATIEKTNEIDIEKIKELLKSKDGYHKDIVEKKEKEVVENKKTSDEKFFEEKSYDIMDVLNKVKSENKVDNKYHNVSNVDLGFIDELKSKERIKEENDLKDLINTITTNSELNSLNDDELSLDLLDDLKGGNTIVDMNLPNEVNSDTNTSPLENSFFTSGYSFNSKDFEDLKNIDSNLKKNNKLITILISIVFLIIAAVGFYLLYKFLK